MQLKLERLRHLMRFARGIGAASETAFCRFMTQIDETGRMIHGWRERMKERVS